MSYRSIKRVFGETSLERKCRLLFGGCLLLLITAAFWWVDRVAENLVLDSTRSTAQDRLETMMLKTHGVAFITTPTDHVRDLLEGLIQEFESDHDYRHSVVSLDGQFRRNAIQSVEPGDEHEEEILRELARRVAAQRRQADEEDEASTDPAAIANQGADALLNRPEEGARDDRVWAARALPELDEFHYYQPIAWKDSCIVCHSTLQEEGVISAAETGIYAGDAPLEVVKITLPYKKTKEAINNARAILIAVAIMTVFLSMVALYGIVRYVIVKPLKHLRDVSDQVSRGQMDVRADIHTGDEFEELADSFNRMLRHLDGAQRELREVNQDLDAKVDQLAQLNMTLYDMNRMKGDFLANMSHELRTPLNSIIGFSEVLQGIDALTDKQKRYAKNIQKSGRLLLEMINDILDLAKLEAGKMEVRPSEFQLDGVVQAQCDMVRSLTEEKNIDLHAAVPRDLPPLYQDQSKVQQILTNLLSNAIKFTPEGGRIEVTAAQDSLGRLEMKVADTGVGIAEEDWEVIFEKFRQSGAVTGSDGLKREYSGTGLGLSILKELCKLLHGEISFTSELGKGSTFRVVLPWICQEPTEEPSAEPLQPALAPDVTL